MGLLRSAELYRSSHRLRTVGRQVKRYHVLSGHTRQRPPQALLAPRIPRPLLGIHSPGIRFFGIATIARQVLKLRYWVIGGAVGGGVALKDKYDNFRNSLPELPDFSQYFPDATSDELRDMWTRIRERAEVGSGAMASLAHDGLDRANSWLLDLEKRLGSQIREGIGEDEKPEPEGRNFLGTEMLNFPIPALQAEGEDPGSATAALTLTVPVVQMATSKPAMTKEAREERRKNADKDRLLNELEEELRRLHAAGQTAIDRLEVENRELRDALNEIRDSNRGDRTARPSSQSPIEMYSEILDLLSAYDSAFDTQDHLPRIVVVGDQSAGKTSVLEMIAQARIFPRGAGEMMTRSPVQVTLSDGPDRLARFRDSSRDYDLDNERDLVDLRREIELRMRASVRDGRTVSKDVISLSVKGPGLSRMVLIDLPGIIATVTADMATDTKDTIYSLSRTYMTNPNAIILCIQDGSIDAERSNVTDLVNSIDPDGSRTIFVLTKIDLAEKSVMNPERIRKILEGRLFPMKALGYFAVVTGRGNKEDSIEEIQKYEQEYFRKSGLLKQGVFKPHQTTTKNLSHAVSERFWKMVRDTVEAQSLNLKAQRFNLEAEWKNHFPKHRPMDRKELYERSRVKIMDDIMTACLTANIAWVKTIEENLWRHFSPYLFENIYLPAACAETRPMFNTILDIKLREWRDKNLEQMCLTVGSDAMKNEIRKIVEAASGETDRDTIYDDIKKGAVEVALQRHKWERQAIDRLRSLVASALDDHSIATNLIWDHAIEFWQTAVGEKMEEIQKGLRDQLGPGFTEKWLKWRSVTEQQKVAKETLSELEKMQKSLEQRGAPLMSDLTADDINAVKKNLELKKVVVDTETVVVLWNLLKRQAFLKDASKRADVCRNSFYYYKKGTLEDQTNCDDALLFSRVRRMISQTSRSLAQQIDESEVRRFERELKKTVNEFGQTPSSLLRYFSGKRVELAEKLKQIRQIQEKLDVFVATLSDEEKTKRARFAFSL